MATFILSLRRQNLFSVGDKLSTPLADRLRPYNIDDIVGQEHILAHGKPLRRIIKSGNIPNLIFYGPSGIGKTTLAKIIAKNTKKKFKCLNATTANTSDLKEIFAESDTLLAPNGILLYLDEIQYFNKRQQQTLLEFIENGKITLIASTTENPYFYIYNAILSRCTVFEFKPISVADIKKAVIRAFQIIESENNESIIYNDDILNIIANSASGDVRKAINCVELSVISANVENGKRIIEIDTVKSLAQANSIRYDKLGDEHYDVLSAFQKSMRGSDTDAAIHYLARLLCASDLISACRRLMVCACEDVGLAYPQIIPIVKSCVDCALQIGLPEARIPLANAVIMVCNAPKSNSAYNAINSAMSDVQKGIGGNIPRHLQNKHYDGAEVKVKGQFYNYPHDYENSWIDQQYLPDDLKNKIYYKYGNNKIEQAFKTYWSKIKGAVKNSQNNNHP